MSNNFGGLGKTWLGGYSEFNSHELRNKIPNSNKIIKLFNSYKKNKFLNYNSNNFKNLPSYILDLKKIKSKKIKFFNIKLVNDFFNHKRAIFRPKKIKKIKYIDGQLIDIKSFDNSYVSQIQYGKKKF